MDLKIVFLLIALSWGVSSKGRGSSSFQYTILNIIQQPLIYESTFLTIRPKPNNFLIDYMKEACLLHPDNFTQYTVTFYPKVPGYFVNAMNGVAGNYPVNKTYWEILNNGVPLSVGVSEYVPKAGDSILFNLIQCKQNNSHQGKRVDSNHTSVYCKSIDPKRLNNKL